MSTLALFDGAVTWGWRGRYGRAHAYDVLSSGRLVALCTRTSSPSVTGSPTRRRCAYCAAQVAKRDAAARVGDES